MSTYYREKSYYLDASIRSIWNDQTRRPDQVVLVEDGELPPELESVIDKWSGLIGSPFVVVRNSTRQGLAVALNNALQYATGDLIARMDSDDISMPERFAIQEQYMIDNPDVDILGGSLLEFNDQGTLSVLRKYPSTNKDILSNMAKASPFGHPSVMFRRRFFDDGFRYQSKYRLCEDVTLWYDAACAGRVMRNISDVLVRFRRNDLMMGRRSHDKAWNEFRAYTDGILRLYGIFSVRHFYSVARLLFRLLPTALVLRIYNSRIRSKITQVI